MRNLAVFDDGSGEALYATAGGVIADSVWRYRGYAWEPVGAGQLIGTGSALMVLDSGNGPQLFSSGSTVPSGQWWFKRWNGMKWVDPPPGLWQLANPQAFPPVYETLYPMFSGDIGSNSTICGMRMVVFPSTQYFAARWTGTQWVNLGGQMNSAPGHFIIFDDGSGHRLYMAGGFTAIGGEPIRAVARWNGASWESLGLTPEFQPGIIRDLCVFDDGSGPALYLASHIGSPSGSPLFNECITRWDGQQWSSVGGGIWAEPGTFGIQVWSLEVFDDGTGPALFVAGNFQKAGGPNGIPARSIAKWNGSQWSALGAGIGALYGDMAAYTDSRGPSLFVATDNSGPIGGGQSPKIGQWVGCPNCYINCDLSTTAPVLNIADFGCFLRKFAANDPYANCNVDATIDIADFACFMQKFAAGCQ